MGRLELFFRESVSSNILTAVGILTSPTPLIEHPHSRYVMVGKVGEEGVTFGIDTKYGEPIPIGYGCSPDPNLSGLTLDNLLVSLDWPEYKEFGGITHDQEFRSFGGLTIIRPATTFPDEKIYRYTMALAMKTDLDLYRLFHANGQALKFEGEFDETKGVTPVIAPRLIDPNNGSSLDQALMEPIWGDPDNRYRLNSRLMPKVEEAFAIIAQAQARGMAIEDLPIDDSLKSLHSPGFRDSDYINYLKEMDKAGFLNADCHLRTEEEHESRSRLAAKIIADCQSKSDTSMSP